MQKNESFLSIGLLLLRLGFGGLMLTHGVPKLMNYATLATQFPDPLGVGSQLSVMMAIGAEVGCASLIILGLFTRLAAIPLVITMLVAVFIVHGADPFAKKELALLYFIPFLTLLLTGPGRFACDHLLAPVFARGRKSVSSTD